MPQGMTLLHLVVAALTFMLGSGADTLLSVQRAPHLLLAQGAGGVTAAPEARLLSATADDQLMNRSLLGGDAGGLDTASIVSAAQVDPEEPLDGDIESADDVLDAPIQQTDEVLTAEPLDAPLADDEVLDAPVEDVEVLDVPRDDTLAVQPVSEVEPLDAPVEAEIVDQPIAEVEPLDADLETGTVAAVPIAKPVAKPAPVVYETKGVPLADDGRLVTSVRKKGEPGGQVVVTAGHRAFPIEHAACDVAVVAGRATVGSDCGAESVVVAHQPAIPRSPSASPGRSTALISTDNPSLITSRRDGVQIGAYPEPTLGDSIATTVRAAIFPEDVIVPDVLIVPGELTVAGNQAREDPIVLWRSELEAAAATTGMPVEILATAIRVTSNGAVDGQSATGVGLMFVPVEALVARGVDREDWFDPAVNIRVGAEVLAEVAAASNVESEAALTSYVAATCGAAAACIHHEATQMRDWIVHYRLRSPHVVRDDTVAAAESVLPSDWPFATETNEALEFDPFARTGSPFDHDDADDEDRPGTRLGGRHERDEPESTAPPFPIRVSQD